MLRLSRDTAVPARKKTPVVLVITVCVAALLWACGGCVSVTVMDERGATRRYYRPSVLEFFSLDGSFWLHFGGKVGSDAPTISKPAR